MTSKTWMNVIQVSIVLLNMQYLQIKIDMILDTTTSVNH